MMTVSIKHTSGKNKRELWEVDDLNTQAPGKLCCRMCTIRYYYSGSFLYHLGENLFGMVMSLDYQNPYLSHL